MFNDRCHEQAAVLFISTSPPLSRRRRRIFVISNMQNIIYIFKLLLYKTPVFNYKLNLLMINLWKFLPRAPSIALRVQ